jgi:ribosome biogenesis SPOUT family RNA methylase Rps3
MSEPIFILEQCETKLFPWSLIEYEHVSKIVGKHSLWFTNISKEEQEVLLEEIGIVKKESVTEMDLKKACILDPFAEKTLSPEDDFDYYVFGGILGDNPPTKKTDELITSKVKWESRNIGKGQFPTDNAFYVVKKITEGKKFSDFKFQDGLTIVIDEGEEVELPFRYVIVDGKPLISAKLLQHITENPGF